MAQLAEWPAVVTCGRTVEEARAMLIEAAREMIASYGCRARRRRAGVFCTSGPRRSLPLSRRGPAAVR
jgi:hypothetical protein